MFLYYTIFFIQSRFIQNTSQYLFGTSTICKRSSSSYRSVGRTAGDTRTGLTSSVPIQTRIKCGGRVQRFGMVGGRADHISVEGKWDRRGLQGFQRRRIQSTQIIGRNIDRNRLISLIQANNCVGCTIIILSSVVNLKGTKI